MGCIKLWFAIFVYFVDIYVTISFKKTAGVCKTSRGTLRCCSNFFLKNTYCLPCIGTFGVNCSGGPCVYGYYGFGCSSKCNCTTQQYCDRTLGCRKTVKKNETEHNYVAKILPVVFGIIFSGGSILVVTNVFFCKRENNQISLNYIEDMFLPQVYDQPNLDNESAIYVTCNDDGQKNEKMEIIAESLDQENDYLEFI